MKTIDLRSDTVTLPSDEMRRAMYEAELGDDVYGEDPTVNELQEISAQLLGKQAALFVSSGTQGNLISMLAHCGRGAQAIAGDLSHIILHEAGAAGVLGGIFLRNVPNTKDGRFDLKQLDDITDSEDDIHKARTQLICLENTWHGQPLTLDYVASVEQFARKRKIKMHLDGARLFNASVALKVKPADLTRQFDSIQFCFSKGLAAPVGSMICGSEEFIEDARRIRKMLGGGMRQVGVLAAACKVSLEKMIDRLADDHTNAKLLADELEQLPGVTVESAAVRTNMVFFRVKGGNAEQEEFVRKLRAADVIVGAEAGLGIRAVTHYGIEADQIKEVVTRIKTVLEPSGATASLHA